MKALNLHYISGGGFPVETITGTKYKSALLTKDIAETLVYQTLYMTIKQKRRYFLSNLYHKLRKKSNKDYDIKRHKKLEQIMEQCKEEKYFNKHYQLNGKGQDLLNWYLFGLECIKKFGIKGIIGGIILYVITKILIEQFTKN